MFAHYRAIAVTFISRKYIKAVCIKIDLHNSELQVRQRYVSIDRILARRFDNYLTFLYKGKGEGKFYLEDIPDKQRVLDACFLVDSFKSSPYPSKRGGNVNGSFALLGEVV